MKENCRVIVKDNCPISEEYESTEYFVGLRGKKGTVRRAYYEVDTDFGAMHSVTIDEHKLSTDLYSQELQPLSEENDCNNCKIRFQCWTE